MHKYFNVVDGIYSFLNRFQIVHSKEICNILEIPRYHSILHFE